MEEIVSDIPLITNDAVVFGILMALLLLIFRTSEMSQFKKFYTIIPALLLCYFLPSLFSTFAIISPHWIDVDLAKAYLAENGYATALSLKSFNEFKAFVIDNQIDFNQLKPFAGESRLYFMASRYLLPSSLILLTLSINLKEVFKLGPKALIMFGTGTIGVILGGPLAILIFSAVAPDVLGVGSDAVWRGMTTIAGSWIGGGANQAAMYEIFSGDENLISGKIYSVMITVDVIVAEIWMAFLLLGVGKADKIDKFFKADASAVKTLKDRMQEFSDKVARIPSFVDLVVILGIALGFTGLAHLLSDIIAPYISENFPYLAKTFSLGSGFFWLIVIATTSGIALSFTKVRNYEGAGASKVGSVFIYVLVVTIGMKMNIMGIFENPGLFAVGLTWMAFHVGLLFLIGKLIKAPFFFLAVGSKANIGGAASAPVVAGAFHPSLAPVGVLLAVLGYALGTYGAYICGLLMQAAS